VGPFRLTRRTVDDLNGGMLSEQDIGVQTCEISNAGISRGTLHYHFMSL
jgi:hypothetical protein